LAVGLILAAGGSARADDTTSPKFFKICNGTTLPATSAWRNGIDWTANTNTGSTIYSGAPIGSARFLTHQLYGVDPPINQCPSPHD
jgi:hypothetical protein